MLEIKGKDFLLNGKKVNANKTTTTTEIQNKRIQQMQDLW